MSTPKPQVSVTANPNVVDIHIEVTGKGTVHVNIQSPQTPIPDPSTLAKDLLDKAKAILGI
jgi:hypothetical protein